MSRVSGTLVADMSSKGCSFSEVDRSRNEKMGTRL